MKIIITLSFVSMLISTGITMAQKNKSIIIKKDTVETAKPAQNVFAELFGPGILLSANYDSRFTNHRDGIGGRIGIGYLSSSDLSIVTIPAQINYLLGKDRQYLELGLGATYLSLNGSKNNSFFGIDNASTTLGTMTIGYRLQPLTTGFSFRASINPLFDSSNFYPFFFGISFGYTIK